MTNVLKEIDGFRNLVNDLHRFVDALIATRKKWYILCSAMDVVGHSENAIIYYENDLDADGLGSIYLSIYGLFQALVVQQDAIYEICRILDITRENNEDLDFIRDVRNDSSGHPVNRSHKVPARSNFFYSLEWSKEKFTLNRAYHDGSTEDFIHIYPMDLIKKQRTQISNYLIQMIEELKKRENEHREIFKGTSVKEIFNGKGYCFEKIGTYLIGASTPLYLAKMQFTELESYIEQFKNELTKRGINIDSRPGISIAIREIEHPMRRLHEYFNENVEMDMKDLLSFCRHTEILFEDIIVMAGELDEEYSEKL